MSDDPTERIPEPTAASPTVDSHAADAAAPTRRMVSAPVWAILLGVILLLAGGAAAAVGLGGGSSGPTGPTAAPITTTSTSPLASDFPAGAAPSDTAAGTSGGGSTSGGSGGKSSTKMRAPTVIPHLGQTDFGTCTSGQDFYADVSWITKNATRLSITNSGHIYTPGDVKENPSGFFHLGIACGLDHDLVFTVTGPGGTTRATVTLKYVVDEQPHVKSFTAPGTTDCQAGTTTSVQFSYQTVNATQVKISLLASPLKNTSGGVSYGFTCPPMSLGTETYQVTLTAANSYGGDTRIVSVSLHPTS